MTAAPRRTLHLVDGSGYIFRAYHALPPMTRPDGTPVNAIYGFTAMLLKLMGDLKADHLAVVFDSARKTFRNDIYPAYKAQRPPPPEDLVPQFPLIREAVAACQVPCLEKEGFEADDLIATLATRAEQAGWDVVVVSADKDLMQLVRPGIALFDPMKNKPIDADAVFDKFGVTPDKVIDVQALAGDSSDNVPGVPGIGVKTAAQLIGEYGDLETLLARAGEIRQPKRRQSLIDFADQARISRRLVELDCDVPLDCGPEDLAVHDLDAEKLRVFLEVQGFKSLMARLPALRQSGVLRNGGEAQAEAAAEPEPPATIAADGYALVTDEADLAGWLARAIDTGTLALAVEAAGRRIVGIALAVGPGEAAYVPLRHGLVATAAPAGTLDLGASPSDVPKQMSAARAAALLAPVLADPGVLKVGHDIKAAMHALAAEGVPTVAPVDDTMAMSYALDGSGHGHGLGELAQMHFGHQTVSREDLCGKGRTKVGFDALAPEAVLHCAAESADVTLRLHRFFRKRLLEARRVGVYERFDRPLVRILYAMEDAGVAIDSAALGAMSRDFATRMAALETECHRIVGEAFNLGSPKQLGEILFERLGLPGGRKSSKTGAWSTDADVLEELALVHDLPARILDWRQLQKLKSTYADALVGQVAPHSGRIHTTFAMTATSTGRLSSIDPNLQNIPIRTDEGRRIREAFVAAPGNVLVSADYSQIELRLMAHVGDVAALKSAFASGEDIHAATASQVFGVPIEGMDPMMRRRAKAINFGIIYGISAFGLARQLGIPNAEAKGYIAAYFDKYPEIRTYMETTKDFARAHGYVRTPFGRVCITPGIGAKIQAQRGFAERAAINAPIQGGAADIMKRAMIRVDAALRDANLAARAVLQVHDELVFEVAEADADALIALIRPVMEQAVSLSVPLVVDAGKGKTWASAH